MPLVYQIDLDLKEAMRNKEEQRLSTLRMLRASLKNKQIELQHELGDDEVAAVIRTMVKQYRDAVNDFEKAGRNDLADRQQQEITILEAYLPAAMPEAEIETIAKKIIDASQATAKDLGKVMGAVMKEVAGRADGNTVRAIVQRMLTS